MRRRVLRNALYLADQAEREIRAAGRPLPPRDWLLSSLFPVAKLVSGACRNLDAAAALHAQTQATAMATVETSAAAVDALVAKWLAGVPAGPRWAEFDPRRHKAALVEVPVPDEGEPDRAAVTSC